MLCYADVVHLIYPFISFLPISKKTFQMKYSARTNGKSCDFVVCEIRLRIILLVAAGQGHIASMNEISTMSSKMFSVFVNRLTQQILIQ